MGRGAPCRPIGGTGTGSDVAPIDPLSGRQCGSGVSGSLNFTGVRQPIRLSGGGGNGPLYFSPDFDVLGLRPSDGLIKEVRVEETSGFDLPVCRIRLGNVDKRLNSTLLAKEQSKFRLRLGWNNPGLQEHGTFIVQRPRFRFEGSADGRAEVEILAYGEQVKLAATERREVYRKMRDSDIAQRIAERHGFEADVDSTGLVHDQVIQANESDYKFLARRALLHGFLVMVEDGVLKFHSPRPCESGIRFTCLDPDASLENFTDFQVQSRTFMRGLRLRISQVNPITKEEFEVVSDESPSDVQRELGELNWQDLVTLDGERPERFITNEGHEQRREQLKDQVNRMAQATRWVELGGGNAVGVETLRPQQILTMNGIGRSDGRYLTTRVRHCITAESGGGGFTTKFEVVRAGAGALDSVLPGEGIIPTTPTSAGSLTSASSAVVSLLGGIV